MENILSVIKNKNPEDITQKELNALRELIEDSIRQTWKLQTIHRELTGRDCVPAIRL